MVFVADHIATALARTRAAAELRQRNAELAVINEIGEALAKQLDFQAIIDAVGERVGDDLRLARPVRSRSSTPTTQHDLASRTGPRTAMRDHDVTPIALASGLTSKVIETRRTASHRTPRSEAQRLASWSASASVTSRGWASRSSPANACIGVLSVSKREQPYAFTEADERLLSTIASSMGVALENARLFDETKRLLGETEQRNAELAVINEIGAALGKQLDFQAIVRRSSATARRDLRRRRRRHRLYDRADRA